MQTEVMERELSVVEEPQLDFLYYPKTTLRTTKEENKETLNVLSLFLSLFYPCF